MISEKERKDEKAKEGKNALIEPRERSSRHAGQPAIRDDELLLEAEEAEK
jgi:hypothetical protein